MVIRDWSQTEVNIGTVFGHIFLRMDIKLPLLDNHTGGIEKFSAKENFREILKVSHFYLRFSSNQKP